MSLSCATSQKTHSEPKPAWCCCGDCTSGPQLVCSASVCFEFRTDSISGAAVVTLELVGETRLSHPPHLLYIKRHINPTPTLCPTGWTTSRGVCSKHLTRLQPPPLHSPPHNHPKLPDRELESQTEKLQRRAAARVSSSSLLTVDPRVGGTVPLHQETGLNEGRAFYANAFVVFTFVQILLGSD